MEETVSQRVKNVIKYLGYDPETELSKFSRKIGLERPDNVYNVINGKTKNPASVFELITKTFENVNPAYLFWDRKPMIFEKSQELLNNGQNDNDSKLYWLEKYNKELSDNERLYAENKGQKNRIAEQSKLIERYEKEIKQLQARIKELEEKNTGTE
jgi:hypothetical protein